MSQLIGACPPELEGRQLPSAQAIAVVGDVREEKTATRTISAAKEQFGKVDILINNIGIGIYKSLIDTSAALI